MRKLDGTIVGKVNVTLLPEVKPIPLMVSYTSTDRNISVEDEYSLSHVPYMGDTLSAAEEPQFGHELRTVYEEGIHGTEKGLNKFLNDQMLYQVISELQQSCQQSKQLFGKTDSIFLAFFK